MGASRTNASLSFAGSGLHGKWIFSPSWMESICSNCEINVLQSPNSSGTRHTAPPGSWYKIWHGYEPGRSDGFENKPSVMRKTYQIPNTAHPPTTQVVRPTHKMAKPTLAQDSTPENCIRRWYEEMGGQLLPCARQFNKVQLDVKNNKPAIWTNISNKETVDVEPTKLRAFNSRDTSGLSVIIATGKKTGRRLLFHHSVGKLGSWYSVWEWPRYRSSNGFEPFPSFVKLAVDVSTSHARSIDRVTDVSPVATARHGSEQLKAKPISSSELDARTPSRLQREKHVPQRYSDQNLKGQDLS